MAKIILQDVRCSYVFVAEQRKNKDDGAPGGYGVQILLPKDNPQYKKLKKLVEQTLIEAVGETAAKKKGKFKLPIRDGDEERDGEEYENMYFMNANRKKKPGMVNRAGETPDPDDIEEYCYSGAYFHVSMNVYYFKAKDGGKPGVALGLNNVMFRKKGDRLDGTVSATSDFADFADEGDPDFDEDDL